MTVEETTGISWDPYDAALNMDPYPLFQRLRDDAPLYYNDQYDFYLLSRADDVEQALTLEICGAFGQCRLPPAPTVIGFGRPKLPPLLPFPLGHPPSLGNAKQRVHVFRRVVHHLREDHRARRGQRAPRPPEMQRARMPVTNRLLARRCCVDRLQRKSDLDQLLACFDGHVTHFQYRPLE